MIFYRQLLLKRGRRHRTFYGLMQYTTKRIEVDSGVHRLVEYAFDHETGKSVISMRYEGKQLNPFVIYGPIVVDSDNRALEIVEVLTRWLYRKEKNSY